MVPFFITQLRTQKKNVYDIQGPGIVLLRSCPSQAVHDATADADRSLTTEWLT